MAARCTDKRPRTMWYVRTQGKRPADRRSHDPLRAGTERVERAARGAATYRPLPGGPVTLTTDSDGHTTTGTAWVMTGARLVTGAFEAAIPTVMLGNLPERRDVFQCYRRIRRGNFISENVPPFLVLFASLRLFR